MADEEEEWVRPDTWATFDDLSLRYPSLTSDDEERAEAYLTDATALIDAELEAADIDLDEDTPTTSYLARLTAVCCHVVMRAMDGEGNGVSGYSLTADVFKESFEYSNPSGDLYLTEQDRRMLGIAADQSIEQFFPYADQWGVSDE